MTKNELKMKLEAGAFLVDLFDFTYGQECLIYKGNFETSDQIIYIPDVDLNEIDKYTLDMTIDMIFNMLKDVESAEENGIDCVELDYYEAVLK